MSWFGTTNWETIGGSIAKTAKSALKQAQKNIDKVLEIPEVHVEATDNTPKAENGTVSSRSATPTSSVKEETDGFFSMFGVNSLSTVTKSSSKSSLNDDTPRSLQEPSLSRRASTSSLSRLRSVDTWSTSELHAVSDVTHPPDHSVEILTSPPDNILDNLVSVDYLSVEPVSHHPPEKDALEEALSEDSDSMMPVNISQGRLEILFHDEEPAEEVDVVETASDALVNIPLDLYDASAASEEIPLQQTHALLSENSLREDRSLLDVSSENLFDNAFSNGSQSVDVPDGVWTDVISDSAPFDGRSVNLNDSNPVQDVQAQTTVDSNAVQDVQPQTTVVKQDIVETDSLEEPPKLDPLIQKEEEPVENTRTDEREQTETDFAESNSNFVKSESVTVVRNDETGSVEEDKSTEREIDLQFNTNIAATNDDASRTELESLQRIIVAREQKIADLNSESVKIKEENDNLKSEIALLKESALEIDRNRNEMADHFAQLERKLQAVNDEKKSLSEQLKLTKNELSNRDRMKNTTENISGGQLKDVLRQVEEKDVQIKELLEEGEKLSKQQFQSSNHIKKLRARQTELEAENAKLKNDLDDRTNEITALKSTLSLSEDLEQKNAVANQQSAAAMDRLEKDLLATRNLNEESKSKVASLQSALDVAYKELAELHRQRATHDGQLHETLLSAEIAAKEELRQALDLQRQELVRDHEELTERVEILQNNVSRLESILKRKEESFREEVADYQHRLQEAIVRNEELSQNLAQATRPLMRHNETLQKQMTEQAATFEKLEQNFTKRLQESAAQLSVAQERERAAVDRLTSCQAKLQALEAQMTIVREERHSLSANLEAESGRCRTLDARMGELEKELDAMRSSTNAELGILRREKQLLEHQTALQKENVEMERRKVASLTEQINELKATLQNTSLLDGGLSQNFAHGPSVRRSDSMSSQLSTATLEPDGRWSPSNSSQVASSLYDVLRGTGAPFIDSVQSQLRLKDGELQHVKNELKQLEIMRQTLSDQLIKSGEKAQEMERMKVEMEVLRGANTDINHRYNAMLQMYGEKAEELQELRLDYDDMKALYKSQIDALTRISKDSLK
ncbi:TATA element modulatory factor-like [Paramacrobiotus metropolitanus]|uniref:TATA element modulatory factor-like n=1 Tax=Paramacrobiotus metropolitanus TaxID=2943436 RepID=UPI0024464635|nr:TATA element modulatory factor-like [Paramacrobiotus metropolitanus]